MSCPGQLAQPTTSAAGDLVLLHAVQPADVPGRVHNGGTPAHTIPNNSQFKCYDGMHNWNQVQPAPYTACTSSERDRHQSDDRQAGRYELHGLVPNHAAGDHRLELRSAMLPTAGTWSEMIVPPGYELVKEEDKNLLIGDNYIAPVTSSSGASRALYPARPGGGSVAAVYNANQGIAFRAHAGNAQNPTQAFGRYRPCRATGRHRQRRKLLAVRGRHAHRSGLHQPVPAVGGSGAVRRRQAQPLPTASW